MKIDDPDSDAPPRAPTIREDYDDAGRLIARIFNEDEDHPQNERFTYDEAGRVISYIVGGDPYRRPSYQGRYDEKGRFVPLDREKGR